MMKQLPRPRTFAVGLLAALVLLTAGFSFAVAAQGQPKLAVLTSGAPEKCDLISQDRPAVIRGERFAIDVHGLSASEPVAMSFTFPDGRVYSPVVTQPGGPNELDGIVDQIEDPGFFGQTNSGGDYENFFQTTNAWPRGCYKVTAQGMTGSLQASEYLVLKDAPLPPNEAGPLVLEVRSHTGLKSSDVQGTTVDIYGRKFMSGEVVQLRMIQPDGTIINLSSPPVSMIGSFQTSVVLGNDRLVGDYTFVATSGNGHNMQATFTLKPQVFTLRGLALLNISNPSPAVPVQGQAIQLQGKLFDAGETVTIRLVQANGIVRTLSQVQANEIGEFTLDLPLGHQLPTGSHKLVVSSITSLKSVDFQLNVGPGLVPPVTMVTPIIGSMMVGVSLTPEVSVTAATATVSPSVTAVVTTTAAPSVTETATVTATVAVTATATATIEVLPGKMMPGASLPSPVTATPSVPQSGVDASPLIPIETAPTTPYAPPTPVF